MNQHQTIISTLEKMQVIPVVSLPSVEAGLELAKILMKVNLPVVEITFRTPFAADAIAGISKKYPSLLILAGTILTKEQADIAIDVGAKGIVFPGFNPELVQYCLKKNAVVCPGISTPSEALGCVTMGLKLVKFFPAEISGGIQMIKAMSAVFDNLHFMPTGGINQNNMLDYLSYKSVVCCGGTWLATEERMKIGKWIEIEQTIQDTINVLRNE